MESEWGWDKLDATERRIAELLLQGKSNSAICNEVYLSRARVQECIKRILIKTGADSTRAAIVLLVEERETLTLLRVLDQASDGVVIVQDQVVKFASRTFHDMHGYAPDELNGRPMIELIDQRGWDFVRNQHNRMVDGESFAQSYDITVLCKGGEQKNALVVRAGHVPYKGRAALLVTFPREHSKR